MDKMTLQEFRPHGSTGSGEPEDFFYHEELTGPQGMRYHLFREKHHTSEMVEKAKRWLRANLDVVKIYIVEEK